MGAYDAEAADVWSLGVVLFALLMNDTPFDIANESDPIFLRFEEEGFSVLEEMIDQPISDQARGRGIRGCLICRRIKVYFRSESVFSNPF